MLIYECHPKHSPKGGGEAVVAAAMAIQFGLSRRKKDRQWRIVYPEVMNMLSATWLMLSALFYSLQLSTGSFPKPLTAEEERYYLELAARGDLEARNVLIERNLRLVSHIMKKYYTQTSDQEDLISIGTIGLIKGINTFDASKGARLATYAARCVENAILTPMGFGYRKEPPLRQNLHFGGFWTEFQRKCTFFADLKIPRCGMPPYISIVSNCVPPGKAPVCMDLEGASFPDRLRALRHQKGLTQKELAAQVGISRRAYLNLETGAAAFCQRDTAQVLADIFGLGVEELLDDYNRFLYRGQGQAIRSFRQQLGMGKKPFARYLGVSASLVRAWETERKQVSRKSWEKYFQGKG